MIMTGDIVLYILAMSTPKCSNMSKQNVDVSGFGVKSPDSRFDTWSRD